VHEHRLPLGWGAPSVQELLVILVIALIMFGAKRLPELARALGQSLGEFRKARDEFEREFHNKSAGEESTSQLCARPPLDNKDQEGVPAQLPQRPLKAVSPPPPAESPPSSPPPSPKGCGT